MTSVNVVLFAQDFGTIRKRLQQARRRGWASGHYKGAHEVWVDAQLVFDNCVTFNSTPADQQTRDMTEQVSLLASGDMKAKSRSYCGQWTNPGYDRGQCIMVSVHTDR